MSGGNWIVSTRGVFRTSSSVSENLFRVPNPKNMMKSKLAVLFALLAFVSVLASSLEAAALRVVVVKTDDVAAYVKEIENGKALLKKLESPAQLRVWKSVAAGTDAGQVVVSIEYPDMVAYAVDYQKVMVNAEYVAWLKVLSKLRTVLSDSLYDEAVK